MPDSIKDQLVAEAKAIKDRIEAAAEGAEKALLKTQFGQRVAHLVERLKDVPEIVKAFTGWNDGPPPGAPATA